MTGWTGSGCRQVLELSVYGDKLVPNKIVQGMLVAWN